MIVEKGSLKKTLQKRRLESNELHNMISLISYHLNLRNRYEGEAKPRKLELFSNKLYTLNFKIQR